MKTLPHVAKSRERAVATVYALFLLIFAAAAVAAMGTFFATEARRTRAAGIEAQQRQLLRAGAQIVKTRLAAGVLRADQPATVSLPLPDDLPGARLTARLESGAGQRMIVRLECELAGSKMRERLALAHDGGAWEVVESELGGG